MILHFDPPVVFNQYVSPVCLPVQGQEFPAGIDTYAIGWGNIQGIIYGCLQTLFTHITQYYTNADSTNVMHQLHDFLNIAYIPH